MYEFLHKEILPSLLRRLEDDVWGKAPASKCLGCPKNGGVDHEVTAECCRRAAPPLYGAEFVAVYQHIERTWSKADRKALILQCVRYVLDNQSTEKPCVFLDQETNLCKIYNHRWLNCRTYGLNAESEWEERARVWIAERLSEKMVAPRKIQVDKDTGLKNSLGKPLIIKEEVERVLPDVDAIESYIDSLFAKGFDVKRINEQLEKDHNIVNAVYEQCTNVSTESLFIHLTPLYEKLVAIESKMAGYDVTQDADNQTYMQFYIYLLLKVLGEYQVQALADLSGKATDENKQFFVDIITQMLTSDDEDTQPMPQEKTEENGE